MVRAVLFDLDGTLLPMDEDKFVSGYFKLLAKKLCPLGIEPQKLFDAVWAGTKAMAENDGSDTNENVFWNRFSEFTGLEHEKFKAASCEFYENEFNAAKAFVGENPLAKETLGLVKEKGMKVIIATNPIFPKAAQLMRLKWLGIGEDEFEYVTPYEELCYAKPNPKYYEAVLKANLLEPEECLMVGNDCLEDMHAAKCAGLDTFLITDCVKENEKFPYNGKKGSFKELIEYIKTL